MKLFFSVSIALMSFIHVAVAFGNGVLKGTVVDKETNGPLIGVNVMIKDTNYGVATDEEGKFIITGIASGNYQVIISMIGYEQKVESVQISDNETTEIKVSLSPDIMQLSHVTILGQKERNVLENPQVESVGLELSTSTVTHQEIVRQGSKTLIDALNFVPGALVETRGRKVKQFFSVRGQRYPYPEYSINGVWQREFFETSYFYPAADIERIEVVRSSAALLTGINGMAGVVNIIPREYNANETSLSLEYGTFGTYRSNISNGARLGNVNYAAGIGIYHTNGPSDMHAKEDMMNFNGSIKWTPTQKLTIRYFLFHNNGKRELRLAEPPASKRFLTELGSYDPIRSTLTNLKLEYRFSQKSKTEFLVYYTNRDPVYIDEDDSTHVITRFPERDWEWGANLIHSIRISSKNTFRMGGIYNHWVAPNGKRFYYGKKNDLETISFVVVDEHNFGAIKIDAGIRWARTYINEYGGFGIDGSGKGFGKVDPLKNVWQAPVMQANLGGSYLLSNSYSLNLNATAGQIKPLPGSLDVNLEEPKNEKRIKLDIGIRKTWNAKGHLSLVGFLVHQKDALVLSGETYDSPGRYMELYLNRDQNQYGLEVETRFTKIWNKVEVFFNATMMNSVAEKDGEMKENLELPKVISSGGLYYQGNHFDMSILPKYVSYFENKRFAAKGLPPQPLGAYVTLDAVLGWSLYSDSFTTRFYLELKNLTDAHYSTVVGYPDFGRTITIGIRHTIK